MVDTIKKQKNADLERGSSVIEVEAVNPEKNIVTHLQRKDSIWAN